MSKNHFFSSGNVAWNQNATLTSIQWLSIMKFPLLCLGDKTVSTVILGWPNPKSRPSRPSLIGLLPYCCVPCPQSPFTARPARSGPEHKNRKKHIGHGARFNDYTGRKHSVGILCPPALCVRSGVQCRTQLDCEGAGALRGFSGGAVGWRPSPPGTNGTTRASRAVPISNSPISKGLLPDLVCGEEGVKVCQDDMCTDLKGHLLEFWGS